MSILKNRRGFLALLGLAGPAVALAKTLGDDDLNPDSLVQVEVEVPPSFEPLRMANRGEALYREYANAPAGSMRFLGLAQLKHEGAPVAFDTAWEDED